MMARSYTRNDPVYQERRPPAPPAPPDDRRSRRNRRRIPPIDAKQLELAARFIRLARREGICRPKRGKSIVLLAAVYNLLTCGDIRSYEDFANAAQRWLS